MSNSLFQIRDHDQDPSQDDGRLRLVLSEDGHIRHVSGAFARLQPVLPASKAQDVIVFARPDEARRVFALKATEGDPFTLSVKAGTHAVIVGDQTVSMQFEWINLPDGRRFLMASDTDDIEPLAMTPARVMRWVDLEQTSEIDENKSNDELRHFMDLSHDVMAVARKDGVLLRLNERFTRTLGYSAITLGSLSLLDMIHSDDRAHVRSVLLGLMRADDAAIGQVIDFEARTLTVTGGIRWMEWRLKRTSDLIYAVGQDMTDIKAHETRLLQQQQQLSEAQSIGHIGHWYWKSGEDTIQWSDELYRIFGVKKDDFVPTIDSLKDTLHRRDVGRMVQAFQRAMIERNTYEMEFRIIRPDGQMRFIRCEGRCEIDEQEDVVALFGVMQDITERTHYERDLRDAKDAAERAYSAKSQFLANMSHELRTPLNAIIGFSEMMQRQLLGPIGTEKYFEYIDCIRESGEHLLDLISDILDMSKIEAGKYQLDLEKLNVSKIVHLASHMIEGRAHDACVKVEVLKIDDAIEVIADRRALLQILLNLLSNAVKFTEPGGAVDIETITREEYVAIKVKDTGIGIPANMLANVTRPFEQAANHYTRSHEGSGLGLAITKELCELHGGSLHIDSTVGVGTTVTIRLPYDASLSRRDKIR